MKTSYNKFKANQGFTLIEILTVLAIIGILTAILIPAVSKAQSRARVTSAIAEINSARTAAVEGAARNGGTLPITEGATAAVGYAATNFVANSRIANDTQAAAFARTGDVGVFNNGARLDQALLSMDPPVLDGLFTSKFAPGGTATWDATMGRPSWVTTSGAWTVAAGVAWTANVSQAAATRMECAVVNNAFTVVPNANGDNPVTTASGINFLLDGVANLPSGRVAYIFYPNVPVNDARTLANELNGSALMIDIDPANPVAQTSGRVIYNAPVGGVTNVYVYLAVF